MSYDGGAQELVVVNFLPFHFYCHFLNSLDIRKSTRVSAQGGLVTLPSLNLAEVTVETEKLRPSEICAFSKSS